MDEAEKKKSDKIQKAIKEKGARWTAGESPVSHLSEEDKMNMLGAVQPAKEKGRSDKKKCSD